MPTQMVRQPFGRIHTMRPAPVADPRAYRTFRLAAPVNTHWERVSCKEYECPDYIHGFSITVDTATELGQAQYEYLANKDKYRKGTMQRIDPSHVVFVYPPGSRPFAGDKHVHYRPVGRLPYYLVHDGDWRGNPTGNKRFFQRDVDFLEEIATHQDKVATLHQRG